MRFQTQKIDFNAEYPCPCCRHKGKLVQITLTEAFGCNLCQQIFVVEEEGYALEPLPTDYPYKRSWYWNGQSWRVGRPDLRKNYLRMGILISSIALIAGVFYLIFINKPEWETDKDSEDIEKSANPQSFVSGYAPSGRPHISR
ncbi:MAG: hypothetical protein F6J93_10190 [Oscillatoria sp. SIO1A7]|nr:hypothetical protein [Oscillatoria sp. SIO1A7]